MPGAGRSMTRPGAIRATVRRGSDAPAPSSAAPGGALCGTQRGVSHAAILSDCLVASPASVWSALLSTRRRRAAIRCLR